MVQRLQEYELRKIIVYSRDEYKQSEQKRLLGYGNVRYFLGDVRDQSRLLRALAGVDFVVHAAALKRIPELEYNPGEAIKTNVLGSMNVVECCCKAEIDSAVLVSTDKACEPVNLYGATKLCAEKYFLAANAYAKTQFNVVRYGNVLASRGSVIRLFDKLMEDSVPITDTRMTRFWITIDEAVDLVFFALLCGEAAIYVPKARAGRLVDIARAVCPGKGIREIGIRPGEKLHETLISKNEKNGVFLVDHGRLVDYDRPYHSNENLLNSRQIRDLIEGIRNAEFQHFQETRHRDS